MAPVHEMAAALQSRSCPSGYYYGDDGFCYRNSGWYWWGRWVVAGALILVFIIILLLLARRARRQRRQGVQPMYGTAWMGGWNQGPPPTYNAAGAPPPEYHQQAPPQAPYPTGTTVDSNQGYYGQRPGAYTNDIPLQQPSNTYYPNRAVDDYAPPAGPPPGKQ